MKKADAGCVHEKGRRVYEHFLFGGRDPIGWECALCGQFVPDREWEPKGGEYEHYSRAIGLLMCVFGALLAYVVICGGLGCLP